MRYTVKGCDKNTGEDRTITIEAPDVDAARVMANMQGILVESVTPAIKPDGRKASADPLEYAGPRGEQISSGGGIPIAADLGKLLQNAGYVIRAIIIAILYIIAGLLLILALAPGPTERFNPDNAWGATANRLQTLVELAKASTGMLVAIFATQLARWHSDAYEKSKRRESEDQN